MALRPTIHKAELDISDVDRQYYAAHNLVLARHPSETDERMMVRLLAFALCADDALSFAGGISNSDEPDLWSKDLTGEIQLWIEIGQPDARSIRKASHRARRVLVLGYGRSVDPWWMKAKVELSALSSVRVLAISAVEAAALAARANRNMAFHVFIQEHTVTFTDQQESVAVTLRYLLGAPG